MEYEYSYFDSNGLNQCPICGESFHLDDGSPKEGNYVTEDGKRLDYHTEVGAHITVFHLECKARKENVTFDEMKGKIIYWERFYGIE